MTPELGQWALGLVVTKVTKHQCEVGKVETNVLNFQKLTCPQLLPPVGRPEFQKMSLLTPVNTVLRGEGGVELSSLTAVAQVSFHNSYLSSAQVGLIAIGVNTLGKHLRIEELVIRVDLLLS
ncbi:hypothetical protein BY996DRAFT_6428650 [Phakopsora pachyrhizi]|nr:hypothetical protein BY996DRAFT_6428650 [Phakopsora pachyrhizi]